MASHNEANGRGSNGSAPDEFAVNLSIRGTLTGSIILTSSRAISAFSSSTRDQEQARTSPHRDLRHHSEQLSIVIANDSSQHAGDLAPRGFSTDSSQAPSQPESLLRNGDLRSSPSRRHISQALPRGAIPVPLTQQAESSKTRTPSRTCAVVTGESHRDDPDDTPPLATSSIQRARQIIVERHWLPCDLCQRAGERCLPPFDKPRAWKCRYCSEQKPRVQCESGSAWLQPADVRLYAELLDAGACLEDADQEVYGNRDGQLGGALDQRKYYSWT